MGVCGAEAAGLIRSGTRSLQVGDATHPSQDAPARRRAEQLKKERGAAGGWRARDLGNLATRQSAAQHPVDRLDPERDKSCRIAAFERRQRSGEGSIELSFPQCALNPSQRVIRHMFASARL